MMANNSKVSPPQISSNLTIKPLTSSQIQMIEEALGTVGEFGEVRLVVEKGRLRFLVTQKSFDALKFTSDNSHEGLSSK